MIRQVQVWQVPYKMDCSDPIPVAYISDHSSPYIEYFKSKNNIIHTKTDEPTLLFGYIVRQEQ